jgi:cell division protein FtsQ
MSRVNRPPIKRDVIRQPRDVSARPTRLKLLLRRSRRFVRPAVWGTIGFVVVMLGIVLVHSNQPGGRVARMRSDLVQATNMPIQDIVIEGRNHTPEELLDVALGVHQGDPILGFSLQEARARIEALSWVQSASVERRMPGTVLVRLEERKPFAIWQDKGKFVLIGRDGQVVANENIAAFGELPLVVGAGAPQAAAPLLDALAAQPDLKPYVVAAVRVGERRWNLRLKSGADVMLPEGAESQALAKLMELQTSQALLDRPLATVDMRLPDRLVVRPQSSPPAPPGKKA